MIKGETRKIAAMAAIFLVAEIGLDFIANHFDLKQNSFTSVLIWLLGSYRFTSVPSWILSTRRFTTWVKLMVMVDLALPVFNLPHSEVCCIAFV